MTPVAVMTLEPRKSIVVEKDCDDEGLSPMSPPDAYAPPGDDLHVPYEEMHPLLRELRDEHEEAIAELDTVEATLKRMQDDGPDADANRALGRFFAFMETVVFPHNRREERVLFPLAAQRLRESGEHSRGPAPTTGIDVLQAAHVLLIQLTAVMQDLFGIAGRLPDEDSQHVVIDAGIRRGLELVEVLRLHIFREDAVVFSLAHKLISTEEFDRLAEEPS